MGTMSSSFGSSRRESHDASLYYESVGMDFREDPDTTLNNVAAEDLDIIYNHSSERMDEVPDNSVALVVTSPPYHAGKEYDSTESFVEYLDFIQRVFNECMRVVEPGGRLIWNVAGLGRKPYIPMSTYLDAIALEAGTIPRGHIIWQKGKGSSGSCAWGTYMKADNPVLRDLHEYLLVYSKGRLGRVRSGRSTIGKEEFLEYTLSVWNVPPASAKRVGHPAPFPVEIPRRLIQLYTYDSDVILDPFLGSGTTAVAAVQTNRHYIGYETDGDYCNLAKQRLEGVNRGLL